MSDSYIAVRGYRSSIGGPVYLVRCERMRSFYTRQTEIVWEFGSGGPKEAFKFSSLRMAIHRVSTLKAVRDFVRRGGTWEIVEITPIKILAAKNDGPLKQLARAAM